MEGALVRLRPRNKKQNIRESLDSRHLLNTTRCSPWLLLVRGNEGHSNGQDKKEKHPPKGKQVKVKVKKQPKHLKSRLGGPSRHGK